MPSEGSQTKERLIEAGTRLFGELNGHEVSNRRLAREAGVNHAMVNYHFGSREGLCAAVFEHCLEQWKKIMLPILGRVTVRLESNPDRSELGDIADCLVRSMLQALMGREGGRFLAVLLNEDLTSPRDFYRRLFRDVLAPFHEVTSRLAAVAQGKSPDDLSCMILGQAIMAQCMTFFRGRVLLMPRIAGGGLDRETRSLIEQTVSASVRGALGLMAE
jgi:AcrR family transcriptional regulator